MISLSALDTLSALDDGTVFNSTHRYARELISAGLAHDDFGRLRITEQGRLLIRHASPTADEHHANLDPFATPKHSHPDVLEPNRPDYRPDTEWRNELPPIPEALPPAHDLRAVAQRMWDGDYATVEDLAQAMSGAPLAWSRERAVRAAGVANSHRAIDDWVPVEWVEAFMDAYEGR